MTNKPRKLWIASLFTFFTIGLGHLYSGEAKKGVTLYFLGQGAILVIFVSLIWLSPSIYPLLLLALLGIGFLAYCLFDTFKAARRNRIKYELKKYNQWYIYILVFAASSFLINPLIGKVIKVNVVQAYKIPSGTMKPTL